MKPKIESPEVWYGGEDIVKVTAEDVQTLKDHSRTTARRRSRLCTHSGTEDLLHEMLIVHERATYVPPHRHFNRSESFHIVEGLADVVIFEDDGCIKDVISMGDYQSGRVFYYRMSKAYYHTLLIDSALLVFHETTGGPFSREDTEFAAWAPADGNTAVTEYVRRLSIDVQRFKEKKR